jgi:hypothetical protein
LHAPADGMPFDQRAELGQSFAHRFMIGSRPARRKMANGRIERIGQEIEAIGRAEGRARLQLLSWRREFHRRMFFTGAFYGKDFWS